MERIKDKTFIVLGPNGMLGQMVCQYFSEYNNIIKHEERFEFDNKIKFLQPLLEHPDAIVINAIGRIKQKTNDTGDLLWSNATLPLELNRAMSSNQILVHPSTDCVFSGITKTAYSIDDVSNAEDSYGWSKRLGEVALEGRSNTLIPRVSIIGPDNSKSPKGLLGWFLSQKDGSELNGYENHLWNGITTLEWCRQIEKLILDRSKYLTTGRIVQLGTKEFYNKFEMLELFKEIYEKNVRVSPFKTEIPIDRRLEPELNAPNLKEQLMELRAFEKIDH